MTVIVSELLTVCDQLFSYELVTVVVTLPEKKPAFPLIETLKPIFCPCVTDFLFVLDMPFEKEYLSMFPFLE